MPPLNQKPWIRHQGGKQKIPRNSHEMTPSWLKFRQGTPISLITSVSFSWTSPQQSPQLWNERRSIKKRPNAQCSNKNHLKILVFYFKIHEKLGIFGPPKKKNKITSFDGVCKDLILWIFRVFGLAVWESPLTWNFWLANLETIPNGFCSNDGVICHLKVPSIHLISSQQSYRFFYANWKHVDFSLLFPGILQLPSTDTSHKSHKSHKVG